VEGFFLSIVFEHEGNCMAGHSAWANIQHRKGRQDEKRGKIWTRIIREITVAAKIGGGDIASNPRLRMAVDKAKESNMPADNIKRAVDRGAGTLEGVDYSEIRYEGYGVGGAALIIDCMTDNKTRTVAEVRHALSKHGGNLGTDGSVAFMFKHCGQFFFSPGTDEESVMEVALDAGADDIIVDDEGSIEVTCPAFDFLLVKEKMASAGLVPEIAEVVMKALIPAQLVGDDAIKMRKLIDVLEDLDDVQEVFTNAVMD
jgi:YebC/PmpR family DNA-binding regulatory protein